MQNAVAAKYNNMHHRSQAASHDGSSLLVAYSREELDDVREKFEECCFSNIFGKRIFSMRDEEFTGEELKCALIMFNSELPLNEFNMYVTIEDYKDAVDIASGLAYCTHLEKVTLVNSGVTSSSIATIAKALSKSVKMKIFSFSEQTEMGDTGFAAIADALKKYSQLTELYLTECQLSDQGAKYIADALRYMPNLQILHLQNNYIGDTGCIYLANAMKSNKELIELRLSKNKIGDDGSTALADSMSGGFEKLKELYLEHNSIADSGAISLALGIQHCIYIKIFNVYKNLIADGGSVALVEASKHLPNLVSMGIHSNLVTGAVKEVYRFTPRVSM